MWMIYDLYTKMSHAASSSLDYATLFLSSILDRTDVSEKKNLHSQLKN